jgi:hypothetical protein
MNSVIILVVSMVAQCSSCTNGQCETTRVYRPRLAPQWTVRVVPDQAVPDQAKFDQVKDLKAGVCLSGACSLPLAAPVVKQPTHSQVVDRGVRSTDAAGARKYVKGPLGLFYWPVR